MKVFRKIIESAAEEVTIKLPPEFIGKIIEILAFEITADDYEADKNQVGQAEFSK